MAILELKINGIEAYLDNTSGAETGCLSLKSNQSDGEVDFGKGVKTTGGVFLKGRDVKDDKDVVTNYKVHMTNVDFKKRMYAPTEIIAVLNIFPVTPTSTTDNQNNNGPAPKPTWYPLTKDYIVSLFQNKKVHSNQKMVKLSETISMWKISCHAIRKTRCSSCCVFTAPIIRWH